MSLSKKIRFEVFKRDGFKCQYCGQTPPSVTLEVDHINPVSKGGEDDINNLITSCFDCNRGKSNIELNQVPNTLQENKEIIEERESQYLEYQKLLKKINNRVEKEIKQVTDIFQNYFPKLIPKREFQLRSIKPFIAKLGVISVCESMDISCSKFESMPDRVHTYNNGWLDKDEAAIKYFCGICWNKVNNTIR